MIAQSISFLMDNRFNRHAVEVAQGIVIHKDEVGFGQGADGKFAMQRVADLADDEDIERQIEFARHFGGDDNSAPWQSQHQVGGQATLAQELAELLPGILAGVKSHNSKISPF